MQSPLRNVRKAHGFDFHLIRRLRRHIPLKWGGKGADKAFAPNQHNFTLHETLRFPAMFRHRDTAITVSVQPKCACGKSDPSVSFAASSPYAGEPRGAAQICTSPTLSGSFPVSSAVSTPGTSNYRIGSCGSSLLKNNPTESCANRTTHLPLHRGGFSEAHGHCTDTEIA